MRSDRSIAGLVVAGGYSTRFGDHDKAMAKLAGTSMLRHVVDRLSGASDELVVNCRAEQVDRFRDALAGHDILFAVDPIPDQGPVAGLRTGLAAINCTWTAVVACDMPFVDPNILRTLADYAHGHDAAVVRLEDGWRQPFQAVYRTDAMADACVAALGSENDRIADVLERIDVRTVDESTIIDLDSTTFTSIDTQTALSDANRRLKRRQAE